MLAQTDRRKRRELEEALRSVWVEKKGEWHSGKFEDENAALDYAMEIWVSSSEIPEGRQYRRGGLSNKEIVKEVRKRFKVVIDDPH